MLVKLAMQLLSLNFVDAKQCGTAHAQSKTSTHVQKVARVVLVQCIKLCPSLGALISRRSTVAIDITCQNFETWRM